MNCTQCGADLLENAAFCIRCGHAVSTASLPSQLGYAPVPNNDVPQYVQPYPPYYPPPNIPDYLIWAIVTTILCQPLGIAAIVFAVLTQTDKSNGRYDSAKKNSKMARLMVMIGMITCLVVFFVYVVIIVAVILLGIYNH